MTNETELFYLVLLLHSHGQRSEPKREEELGGKLKANVVGYRSSRTEWSSAGMIVHSGADRIF